MTDNSLASITGENNTLVKRTGHTAEVAAVLQVAHRLDKLIDVLEVLTGVLIQSTGTAPDEDTHVLRIKEDK